MLQNNPSLGKTRLWEDRTNSQEKFKEFPSYFSTSPAQYFNVESSFSFSVK